MRGDGEGSGLPLDLSPHGLSSRGVLPSPDALSATAANQASSPFPPPPARSASATAPQIHFADRPQFWTSRTINADASGRVLAEPTRRTGVVVRMPPSSDVGTGQAHCRHAPMTTLVRLNDTNSPPISSLLDTGASLSSIDAGLLSRLGGSPTGSPMRVQGLGNVETLGWSTLTFFIPAKTDHGTDVNLECTLDFHVLPGFAPGLCLGLDFIEGLGLSIDALSSKARVRRYTFDVVEHLPKPFAKEAQLCTTEAVSLPARSMAWIPVDTGALAADVDYVLHPRLMTSRDESVTIAGPVAIGNRNTKHVLVGNHSSRTVHLERRTPIADAVLAHLGDRASLSPSDHRFDLGIPLPEAQVWTAATDPHAWKPDTGEEGTNATPLGPGAPEEEEGSTSAAPLDFFEGVEDPAHALCRDAETVLVDDHFRVGVDSSGTPHPEVVALLRRHRDAFALDGRPGLIRGVEMEIPLIDGAELRSEPPRRASPEKRAKMDTALDQLPSWDVIEPAASPVSFPVLMVKQYDKWRFCVDYRNLNSATVSDRYPLPTTNAVFQTLQGKRWFSSLDAIRGYHQLPVAEKDRWKTSFVCHRGLFQYKTVPFGLKNAPAVFQRLMDRVLGALRWNTAVVYIDDVVAATATFEEHLATLDAILSSASQIGLKFSPAKCTFAIPSLTLLGRQVSGAGIAVWEERAKAVQELPRPRTLRDVYHALGLFGYYRAFVDGYAEIAAPLMSLTRGWRYESVGDRSRLIRVDGTPTSADRELVEWGEDQDRSFVRLKRAISSPPILAHPDPSRPYILYVDASKSAFAAALHQVFVDEELPSASAFPAAASPIPSFAPVPRERWRSWLLADRYFGPMLRRLEASEGPDEGEWVVEEGVLVRRTDGKWALPEAALPITLRLAHERGGHFGYSKTFLGVSKSFWRPRLSEAMSFDVVPGMPPLRGKDAVLFMADEFSRMILLEPCKSSIDAAGVAAILSNRVLRLGWRPRQLVTDSEAKLTGQVMQALARSLGAELTPSSPYHQQANFVERSVQTVQNALRTMTAAGKAPWDRVLVPAIELAFNSSPNITTGHRPFDLVFIAHPDLAHAVFDADAARGAKTFEDRLAAASDRLTDAHRAIDESRAEQKRRFDGRRAPLPILHAGDQVLVRLADRPIPGLCEGKLGVRKAGPYAVREVLSPHRVRLVLPDDLRISDEFNVEQLDPLPGSPDPFSGQRDDVGRDADAVLDGAPADVDVEDDEGEVEHVASLPSGPRLRRPPLALREFDMGVTSAVAGDEWAQVLRGPITGAREVIKDGKSVTVRERPIAFQSRLTTPSEKKLVAPELELCCLAWAFARMAHLLEGVPVTVVTDHLPMSKMLTSTGATQYGPVISRCRALLLPHLHLLRFEYRQGRKHSNVDALSRLVG
ncbi:hypothetical protein A4X09_0g7295 [Tilletia walkeri]|uniref:RNA-directed DNA polymerase n=1 Tax=Tilletia walkeri TaxID=117179 RepID=A0A8X7T289_9BASI|nr:hypothetical protein A4X09_0g7295 [Tilletia walkeri]